jgi:aryl-alcohol dehydrogenase-like predicted oxidoreductase
MANAADCKTGVGGSILQKRRLGQTDISVSVLGLGTVKFGRTQGVKYPAAFSLPSDQDILKLLDQAAEYGINLLDTAPAYGSSEERLGKLLQGQRQNWIICTKAGEEFHHGNSHFDFSKQAISKSIERSLSRLKTDYLDIVLVHSNGNESDIIANEDVFSLLAELKQQGKIRAYGMSTKTISGAMATIEHADVAMVAYHVDYTDEEQVIQYAQKKQKGILIKKALNSGHLAGQHTLSDIFGFILQQAGVTSVIIGTINPEHLRENVEAAC